MSDAIIEKNGNSIVVGGAINYASVVRLRRLGDQLITAAESPLVDFADVESCDSTSLALMMVWLRHAKQLKKTIRFVNVPQSLQDIAKMCDVDEILGL